MVWWLNQDSIGKFRQLKILLQDVRKQEQQWAGLTGYRLPTQHAHQFRGYYYATALFCRCLWKLWGFDFLFSEMKADLQLQHDLRTFQVYYRLGLRTRPDFITCCKNFRFHYHLFPDKKWVKVSLRSDFFNDKSEYF